MVRLAEAHAKMRLADTVTVGDVREAVARLAAEGPPEEEVGLAPFDAHAGHPALLPDPALGARK